MQEDYYQFYSVAPVICWIVGDGVSDEFVKVKFNDQSHCVKHENDNIAAAAVEAINWCKNKYQEVLEKDVKPAFKKFDSDNSGAIDKAELGQLSKDLGHELTAE